MRTAFSGALSRAFLQRESTSRLIRLLLGQLLIAATLLAGLPARSSASSKVTHTYITAYGWPDNDPPGSAIAYPRRDGYPTLHNTAGGVGTYDNPVTVATDPHELPIGSRIYLPYLRKYFLMEDWCSECVHQWRKKHTHRVDIWIGGRGVKASKVLARERALTRHSDMIVNPPRDLPVDITPLL